jgi:hypothetical protein
MAIAPNTNFTVGAVFTAAQANAFPRGIMAFNTASATDSSVTSEEVQISSVTFTAETGRLYKISYYEPGFGSSSAAAMTMRIRITNISGAIQQQGIVYNTGAQQQNGFITNIIGFTTGSTTLVATLQNSTGTGTANRSGTAQAILMVEDIGPT